MMDDKYKSEFSERSTFEQLALRIRVCEIGSASKTPTWLYYLADALQIYVYKVG